jgi:hypothetical protein
MRRSPVSTTNGASKVARARLDSQEKFYDDQKNYSHVMYVSLKTAQIVIAALIPISTTVEAIRVDQPWIIAAMGAAVVALESFQQVGRYHENYLRYSVAAEALRREEYLYKVGAGHYANAADPGRLLEESVETIVTRETGTWASEDKQFEEPQGAATPPTPGAGGP